MEQGPNEADIIERCIRERRPLPDAIQNAPELRLGSELFYIAFMDLSSSRSFGFSPGPIPWHAIHLYCEANGIVGDQREDLFYHVERLDKTYLEWLAKDSKRRQDAQSKPAPLKSKRSRR